MNIYILISVGIHIQIIFYILHFYVRYDIPNIQKNN